MKKIIFSRYFFCLQVLLHNNSIISVKDET
jgi:hypothetical protein